MIFLLSLLTFLYKSRMVCKKIRRRAMESCDETHTSIADEYEERAKNVDVATTHPYSSCYDGMLEQSKLLGRARKHQEEARKIRKIFLDIDKEGKSIPADGEMLRKGVLTVSRGKLSFQPISLFKCVSICLRIYRLWLSKAHQMHVLMWW